MALRLEFEDYIHILKDHFFKKETVETVCAKYGYKAGDIYSFTDHIFNGTDIYKEEIEEGNADMDVEFVFGDWLLIATSELTSEGHNIDDIAKAFTEAFDISEDCIKESMLYDSYFE